MEPKLIRPISNGMSNTQGYVVVELYRGTDEFIDYTEHSTWAEVIKDLKGLWDTFYYDCCECNDWELEQLPNGFTNGYTKYLVMTVEVFNSKGWRTE